MTCVECCARLVASTDPHRAGAAAMLALVDRAIARWALPFTRADVSARARDIIAAGAAQGALL